MFLHVFIFTRQLIKSSRKNIRTSNARQKEKVINTGEDEQDKFNGHKNIVPNSL